MVFRTFSYIFHKPRYFILTRLYLPEVTCPSGSDEKWQRVDWMTKEGRAAGHDDQDEGFWLRRVGSVVLKHKVSTLTFS